MLFIMEGSDYWLFASPFAETSQVTAEQALQVVNTADLPSGVRQFGNKFALVRFLDKGDIQVPEIAKVCAKVSIWADAIEDALGLGDSL